MDLLPEPGAAVPGIGDGEDILLGGYEDDEHMASGARIFHSTLRLGKVWWWTLVVCVVGSFVLCVIGGKTADTPVLIAGATTLGVTALCGAIAALRLRQKFRRRVAADEFDQGVLVFESGDVVVRYEGLVPRLAELAACFGCRCCSQGDGAITIEHTYLSRADVELDLLGRAQLVIFFMDVTAKQRKLTVPGGLLVEAVDDVAGYINDTRDRSVLDTMRL